jgi:hypothetical protein
MSAQLQLDDYRDQLVDALRREGARRALASEPREWADAAWAAIADMPAGSELTSDDILDRVGVAPSPGAMGAVFRHAADAGLIRKTGDYAVSKRLARRGGVHAIWRRTNRGPETRGRS